MNKIAVIFKICFWIAFFPFKIEGQVTIGQPDILNFYHERTNAGSQNWAIGQDSLGTMYFANNSGLLTYNGKEWKLFRLPNKTIVRSLCIAPDVKIFVGGQDELGFFFPDKTGTLQYHSLVEKLPVAEQKFGDVWNIAQLNALIFFRTGNKIFQYDRLKNRFTVFAAPKLSSWSFMDVCNGKLYAQYGKDNLVELKNNNWEVKNNTILKNKLITSVQSVNMDSMLVFTLQHGAFLSTESSIEPLQIDPKVIHSQIISSAFLGGHLYALGTISNGIFIMDANGHVLSNFSSDNGMQNDNVLSLFLDKNRMLWSGLDEGIALMDYFSPIRKIAGFSNIPIPSYTASVFHNKLFIGTPDGVYSSRLTTQLDEDITMSKADFKKIDNTHRQVWQLFNDDTTMFMGHHNGTYAVDETAHLIKYAKEGSWLFRKIPNTSDFIAGTYEGIQILRKEGHEYRVKHFAKNNILEPFRFIEIDSVHQVVWASHPYRGIYKMEMSADYSKIEKSQLLTRKNGLPNDLNNFVFKINNQIVFTTENGLYEYDFAKRCFVGSKKYQPIFGNRLIKFLVSDVQRRIWFATEKEAGVVENGQLKFIPELEGKLIAGFENIYPYNSKNILVPSHKGIIHLNYDRYQKRYRQINVLLNRVWASGKNDSLLFNGYFRKNGVVTSVQNLASIKLPPAFNGYHFEFASDRYGSEDEVFYSYQLKGYDDGWSGWSLNTSKEYTNISYGKYTFLVRVKDNLGNESAVLAYTFEVLPRWYQSRWAYGLYILFSVVVLFGAFYLHRRRLLKQKEKYLAKQAHLKYVHELEKEHNEKEIVKLKNEQLETEMRYKNKELANTTMYLYKRSRLMGKIKEDLSSALEKLKTKEEKTELTRLLKLIVQDEKESNSWEQFAIHFDEVHNRFLYNLKSRYPDLTPGDLKLCAYLKMNLSSKEIAQLLHLSLKGVENGRYRLRKKLGLEAHIHLSDFILSFKPGDVRSSVFLHKTD